MSEVEDILNTRVTRINFNIGLNESIEMKIESDTILQDLKILQK